MTMTSLGLENDLEEILLDFDPDLRALKARADEGLFAFNEAKRARDADKAFLERARAEATKTGDWDEVDFAQMDYLDSRIRLAKVKLVHDECDDAYLTGLIEAEIRRSS